MRPLASSAAAASPSPHHHHPPPVGHPPATPAAAASSSSEEEDGFAPNPYFFGPAFSSSSYFPSSQLSSSSIGSGSGSSSGFVNYYDNHSWSTHTAQSVAGADKADDVDDEEEEDDDDETTAESVGVIEEDQDDDMQEGGAPLIQPDLYLSDFDMDTGLPEGQHYEYNHHHHHGPAIEAAPAQDAAAVESPALFAHPPLHAAIPTATQPPLSTIAPPFASPNQTQQPQPSPQDLEEELNNEVHPMLLSNPNPMSLGPENLGVVDFMRHWIWSSRRDGSLRDGRTPGVQQIRELERHTPSRVAYKDLHGDKCDFQGIDWEALGITRSSARERRTHSYNNYVNKEGSDVWFSHYPDTSLPAVDNHFRFRKMDVRRGVRLLHFQLRNILGCASRTRAFYPAGGVVQEINPDTGRNRVAMSFDTDTDAHISTLATAEGVLLVGGFYGDYRYRFLDSGDSDLEPTEGRLTENLSGITNHVQIHPSRTSCSPLAAFASNDYGFRVVDLATNRIMLQHMHPYALNCSALNPDGTLRIMVGDCQEALVTDAGRGDVVQRLTGHRDYGFSCDWAPDGWTVATGNQDKSIRIWDARRWTNSNGVGSPIAVIRTEMSGARSLHFSPLGSGKRVLVAAEEADFINIIDAQTFETKQTMDVFGEIGGISFTNAGQDLMALSCDRDRGGILHLERCAEGAEDAFDYADRRYRDPRDWWKTPGYDWRQSPEQIMQLPDSQETLTQRRRRAAMLDNLDPF